MKVYTVRQTAGELNVSDEVVYDLIHSGDLECSKVKNKFLVSEKNISDFLERTKKKLVAEQIKESK